jgi:hypothetical protein
LTSCRLAMLKNFSPPTSENGQFKTEIAMVATFLYCSVEKAMDGNQYLLRENVFLGSARSCSSLNTRRSLFVRRSATPHISPWNGSVASRSNQCFPISASTANDRSLGRSIGVSPTVDAFALRNPFEPKRPGGAKNSGKGILLCDSASRRFKRFPSSGRRCYSVSTFAAQMKSFSDNPPTLWVLKSTTHLLYDTKRSG